MNNEMSTPNMSNEEVIDVLKGMVFNNFDRTTPKEREALDLAIKALEERSHIDKTCKTCKYYSYRGNEYPCSRCRQNDVLVDEIREQQNDRWKDGTPNV